MSQFQLKILACCHIAAAMVFHLELPAHASGPISGPSPAAATAVPRTSPISHAPLTPLQITREFELPAQRWLRGHRGVDIDASIGDLVQAPGDGVISFAGFVVDRPVISVTHSNGMRSSLEPVTSLVQVGSRVAASEIIGTVAEGAHCDGRCLHWGVRKGDVYLDPLLQLIRVPIVLLPRYSGEIASG